MQQDAYTRAGVNIASGNEVTRRITQAVRTTYSPEVLAGIGAFGGLFDADALKNMNAPVLVASTDGVGTKTKVASRLNQWDTIGYDLVNHCANDILVQGARPLFFLDYVASSKLDPDHIAALVISVADACREIGCALLGGETAEMPGVYEAGEVDLVGTIVGVVERGHIIDGAHIGPGDVVLALPSSGLHTNGFSLARRVLGELDWSEPHPELNMSIGAALLATHRCYLKPINQLHAAGVEIKGLAHITGGGVVDNLPRILPEDTNAIINRGMWAEPPIFGLIQRLGDISHDEMFHVFNMGLGMMVILAPGQSELALQTLAGDIYEVGKIATGNRDVIIQGVTS
jgi:phosphoribosylformylglycinamidine cyclo-ligase